MTTKIAPSVLSKIFKASVPKLDFVKHKGEAGKICVIGGSKEYTGAPYFAAISALRCGADLVHVICPDEAAAVIKSYSPELIVHPILNSNFDECKKWIEKMHAVVIGPGLGRENVFNPLKLMQHVRQCNIPIVIDADAIHLLANYPDVIKGYRKAIVTPNVVECRALLRALVPTVSVESMDSDTCKQLADALDHVTVVMKGSKDFITNGEVEISCDTTGSPRRCGGQGDVLCGTMGLMLSWCCSAENISASDSAVVTLAAAYTACSLTRRCAEMAFMKNNRATITTEIIDYIGQVFQDII